MGSDGFFLATGRLTRLQRSTAAALPFGRRHRHLAERRATGPDSLADGRKLGFDEYREELRAKQNAMGKPNPDHAHD